MKKLLFLAAFLIGLAASVQAKDLDSLYAKDLLPVGTKAPNFDLQTADGRHITLKAFVATMLYLTSGLLGVPIAVRKFLPSSRYSTNIRTGMSPLLAFRSIKTKRLG